MNVTDLDIAIRPEPYKAVVGLLIVWLATTMLLWLMAFYDLPETAPPWLLRAQVACFGTDASGLPSSAGWMVLILSPLGMLGGILVAFWDALKNFAMYVSQSQLTKNLLLAILAAVILESVWVWGQISKRLYSYPVEQGDQLINLPIEYPRVDKPAADFTLVNQNNQNFTQSSLRGFPIILSFIFAHCPSVCPTLVKSITDASSRLGEENVKVIFITLDPWRDTPTNLPAIAKRWELNQSTILLSGEPNEVNRVLDLYGMTRSRDEKTGDVIHPALVHIIDAEGNIAYSLNNPSAQWIIDGIKRVAN